MARLFQLSFHLIKHVGVTFGSRKTSDYCFSVKGRSSFVNPVLVLCKGDKKYGETSYKLIISRIWSRKHQLLTRTAEITEKDTTEICQI